MSENEIYPSMTQSRRLTKNGFINDEEGSSDDESSDRSIFVEQLLKSVDRTPKNSFGNPRNTRLYEYEINPILEDYPVQLESMSLRDGRNSMFRNSTRDNDINNEIQSHNKGHSQDRCSTQIYNRNDEIQSPTKSLLRRKSGNSRHSFYSQNIDKKTVRFAETSEGLLKHMPVDPTFNDSDFVYDMQYRI
jgi:hypothetical protein